MLKFAAHLKLGLTVGSVLAVSAVHALFFQPHQAGSGNGISNDATWPFATGSGIYWFGSQVSMLVASSNGAVSDQYVSNHDAANWDQNEINIMAVGFTYLQTPGNNNPWLDVESDTNDLALTWDLPSEGGGGTEFSQLAIIRTSGVYTAGDITLQQGDVVMSFDSLPAWNSSPLAIGISDENGNDTVATGEPTNGVYYSPFNFGNGVIPVGDGSGELVFRWDPTAGQYEFLATPEPSTLVLVGLGAFGLVRRRKLI